MSFSEVQKRYRAAKEIRRYYERNWQLNIAFFLGEQQVIYDLTGNKVRLAFPGSRKKPRLSSNLIRPRIALSYSSIASKELKYRVEVDPAGVDSAAKGKLIHSYLDYLWDTYNYQKTYYDALLWALLCGTAFVKWYFDPDVGPVYDFAGSVVSAGDPLVDAVSPFEMVIDPHARYLGEASWCVHERVRSKEYVKQKYGKDVSGAFTGDSLATLLGSLRPRVVQHRVPSALLSEYWERPSPSLPSGYYVVFSGNTVLYEDDNPYSDTTALPFAAMRETPVPGEVWGDSSISDLRQINVIYNRLRCDILENSAKLSNPPMVAPHGAFTHEPGWEPAEVAYYNPMHMVGGRIDQIRIEPFPAPLVNMLLRLEQEADEYAGVSQLTRGMMPRGVRSAEQLMALHSAESVRRYGVRSDYLAAAEESLNGVLALARKFCTVPRIINVLGEEAETALFRARDLPVGARVRVEIEDTPPPTQSEDRVKLLMALFDRGVLQDPRVLLSAQKSGSLDDAVVDLELDSAHARRENDKMLRGEKVDVEDWHNHAVHILEHNRMRKTPSFEAAPNSVKKNAAAHVAAHQTLAAPQAVPGTQPDAASLERR